jgi:hypothetical protein
VQPIKDQAKAFLHRCHALPALIGYNQAQFQLFGALGQSPDLATGPGGFHP